MTELHSRTATPIMLTALLAATGCTMAQPTLQETLELELAVQPGTRFEIDAGAGSLSIQGDAQATAIEVEAGIYQVQANDDFTLTLEPDGAGGALLQSHATSGMNNDRIDLAVRVPESLKVSIEDGSGPVTVSGLKADLEIKDGSGSIRVSDVDAEVRIDDGSGSVEVQNTSENVRIEDGSGSIVVRNSGGSVTINDESGSIVVHDTEGTVTIADGSGSITVDGAGDFELLEDGSGSVDLDNIRSRESALD